jgi:hypothetical protein
MTPDHDHDFAAAYLAACGHPQTPVPPPDSHAPHDGARGDKRKAAAMSACHCPVCGNACVTRHDEGEFVAEIARQGQEVTRLTLELSRVQADLRAALGDPR